MTISTESFMALIDQMNDGVYFVDRNRTITYWNKSAETISGFRAKEVLGRRCSDNILTHVDQKGRNLCTGKCPLEMSILDRMPRQSEIFMHHKDGHRIPVLIKSVPLIDDQGESIGGVEIFTDQSSLRIDEQTLRELEALAMIDKLTQLPNRNFLDRELTRRMDEAVRYGSPFGLFFMDVDHFKSFNDRYGHDVGDRVLRYIANTFIANARPSDVYGRWGGEEFLGVVRASSVNDMETLGERIRFLVEKSYLTHEGEILQVTLSIGGTLAASHEPIDSIIKRADELLYRCKASGRNRVIIG
ncbi:sensor domain-containing diguanylate cyclase [Desulfatiferula olefinivorans]